MPITFHCPCGKALRVADAHAGRRVKCPACQAIGQVPEPEPDFEIVEEPDQQLAPAPVKARPVARPVASRDEDDEEDRSSRKAKKSRADEDDDEDDRSKRKPNSRRGSGRTDDDEEEDRPRKKRKKKRRPPENTNRSLEGKILNGGVVGGLIAMVVAVIWFVVGLVAFDFLFFYPPVLFIIGLIAFIKGLAEK